MIKVKSYTISISSTVKFIVSNSDQVLRNLDKDYASFSSTSITTHTHKNNNKKKNKNFISYPSGCLTWNKS